jgi:hypothetical protein
VAIRAAADRVTDWAGFRRVVKRQRVAGLVANGLTAAAIPVPTEILAALKSDTLASVRQSLDFAAEAGRLQGLLQRDGISVLFFKGVSLAMLAYGKLGIRHAKDMDLLVEPADVERASILLAAAGYVRIRPAPAVTGARLQAWYRLARDTEWAHRQTGRQVELHWDLAHVQGLLGKHHGLAVPHQDVVLSPGLSLRTLGDDALLLYLCVHGAGHAWCRLKWLADVGALLASRTGPEIDRLYRQADAQGSGRAFGQALLLCARLFGTSLPSGLARRLQRDPILRCLAWLALSAMTRGKAEVEIYDLPFGTTLISVSRLLITSNLSNLAQELFRLSVNADDTVNLPLPRPLHFLYPLLRLPLWLRRRIRHRGFSAR